MALILLGVPKWGAS